MRGVARGHADADGGSARVETIPTTRFQPENAKKAIQKFFQEQQQEDQEQSADDGAEHGVLS